MTTTTLAELAIARPAASRVFNRFGLDYCCGGRRSLEDACQAKGLRADDVLAAISEDESAVGDSARSWQHEPLPALIDFIVGTYHRRLREEIPQLVALATKVEARHAEKTTCPKGIAQLLEVVHGAVLDHLEKEEVILFPLIQRGQGAHAGGPVFVMEREHDDHGANLALLRRLANDYVAPPEACASWQALYRRLAQLEAELMEHIHLENNILFPRALAE